MAVFFPKPISTLIEAIKKNITFKINSLQNHSLLSNLLLSNKNRIETFNPIIIKMTFISIAFFTDHSKLITEHYFYPLSDNLNISPKTPLAVTADPAPAPWITIGLSP